MHPPSRRLCLLINRLSLNRAPFACSSLVKPYHTSYRHPSLFTFRLLSPPPGKERPCSECPLTHSTLSTHGFSTFRSSITAPLRDNPKHASMKEARQTIDQLQSMGKLGGLNPNSFNYQAVLDACSHAGQSTKAMELLGVVKATSSKPSDMSYTLAIGVLEVAGEHDHAVLLMRDAWKEKGFLAKTWSPVPRVVDLHNCSAEVARTVLRCVLLDLLITSKGGEKASPHPIRIITGKSYS